MSTTWFVADPHFGHEKVAGLRGFTVPDHDHVIAENWRRMVGEHDRVWVLGDLTMGGRGLTEALDIVNDLPGTKNLITGNHDPVFPGHRLSHKWQRSYLDTFESVQTYARVKFNHQDFLLSHFPYGDDDHTDEARFTQYRLPDLGVPLVHGHTHSARKLSWSMLRTPMVCVSLEAWNLCPVPLHEVTTLLWTQP